MGGKKGNKSKKSKTKTAVQKAAEARHAKFKQTKVQTFGGKKTKFSKAEKKRITDAGYSVSGYSKAAPKSNTQLQVDKDNAMYGNTFPSGSIGISAASKFNNLMTTAFSSPSIQNFAASSFDKASSWYNKGRLPNEGKMSWRNLFSNDLSQQQQIGKFNPNRKLNWASYARGESNPFRGMPGYGTITGQGEVAGGFQTGPTPSVRQAVERPLKTAFNIGKFVLNPKVAILGSLMKPTALADGTLDGKPTRFNIDAGGLNVGKDEGKKDEGRNIRSLKQVTDVGEKRNQTTDARVNSLLTNAFNIGTKIPFVGPQLQNLKSDIKPYTDRITVETPKNTKKVISEFMGNLDSKSDTTRRLVSEFTTDNPNIPNRFGLETAADVVQTFNPTNKNFAPQLSTSWSKPLQAVANNLVSGGVKNIFQEAALNTGAEGTISPAEGLSIAKQISNNINTPGTLGNFEATKIKNLADQYGGGTIKPTPGTIIKGFTSGNIKGPKVNRNSNNIRPVPQAAVDPLVPPEINITPETNETAVNYADLQNLQQQAYNQQMMTYGVPNYTAQIQPTQNVRPLSRRQYFNRDYFTQFV